MDNDTLKSCLETAVVYFEKSSQEQSLLNPFSSKPAQFCLPFYRSYLAITFQEAKEDEVQRYLIKAKMAVGGSKNKYELLKVVENLAEALRESQCLKDRSVQDISC